ncbi:MAG: FtsX-like permease family protein, partial [Bacteroidota bacterium]
ESAPMSRSDVNATIVTGPFSSAAYPSLIITRYKPLKILKNKIDLGAKHGLKLPVVIQFVLSAVLIISAWVIKDQMEYLQDKNLKNKSDRTLIISPSKDKWGQKMERFQSFKNEVRSLAEVEQVSSAISIPGRGGNGFIMSNLQNSDELHELHYTEIDVNFAEALNLKLLAGTSFLPGQFHKNRRSAVINASALKAYGLSKEDILGRKVLRRRDGEEKYLEIIGVVEDYHFAPLNQQIGPLLMAYNPFRGHILASLNPSVYDNYDRLTNTIEKLEAAWNQVYDNQVFEIRYLDDEFDYLYRHEISLRALFTVFTCVSIFLSSLGLLGLTMFATLKRKSEVGIRKVLGASIINILVLFSRDFMRQIIIAIVLSMPIAYYLMDQWLQNYSYRTTINTWSFIIPGLALLMISLLTVLSETFKSANMSPSKVLREE